MELPDYKTKDEFLREEILSYFRVSPFEFNLTGSRFFRESTTKNSDIDFFTKDSKEVREFLFSMGFQITESNMYNSAPLDINTAIVYRNLAAGIDVQLMEHPEIKFEMQKWLKENSLIPPIKPLKSGSPLVANWWNTQYATFLMEKQKKGEIIVTY